MNPKTFDIATHKWPRLATCAVAFLGRSAVVTAVVALLLLAACDTGVPEENEVDCYYFGGLPPACVSFAFYHSHPSWHPDGHQISYVGLRHRAEDSLWISGIEVFDLATGSWHRVLDTPFVSKSSQAWSPDGEWLTFGAFTQIYKVRADGSDLTQLTFSRENFDPAWSPDGEWIAYTDATPSAPAQGTYIIRPDGSDKQWLPYVRGGSPIWHPSGEMILTIRDIQPGGGQYRLVQNHISDPSRGDTLNPSGHRGPVHAATYSPDGLNIASDIQYSPHGQARFDIFRLNVLTDHVQKLTGDPAISFGAYPAWSPDGRTIAYVNSYWREAVVWLMDADGSNRRRMGPTAPPSWLE